MKSTFEDGRAAQFQEMMQQLTQLQAKYKGVRGELLAKVAEEFARLKPGAATVAAPVAAVKATSEFTRMKPGVVTTAPQAAPPTPPIPAIKLASASAEKMLPSCRMCGRGIRRNDADGTLFCEKGHTRPPARVAQPEGESATQ